MIRHKNSGSLLINFSLFICTLAILASISAPAFNHKSKRDKFREVSDLAMPITAAINKCLGIERDQHLCDSLDHLHRYGYSPTAVEISSQVDTVALKLEQDRYKLTLTPPENNPSLPFIHDSHTYIKTAEIVDRNGRPVIEEWETDPKSGCMVAGFCQ